MVEADPDAEVTVDLSSETVTVPGGRAVGFTVDPFARQMLLDGTDELGYLLSHGGRGRRLRGRQPLPRGHHRPRLGWLRRRVPLHRGTPPVHGPP